ncbi:RNase adapter RapZ [Thalassobaculum salexigens]|uniref:RNase adapter RapZ n=1 Tax=Thalassobaculum salexigens TaxID=455360 RepID=UPI000408DEC6|nr:RNase adapter RapZ [Thalassobaculum salexigens]
MTAPLSVVLVTGLSGAGRTSTLKVLEDLGYEAVDNVPLGLMPALLAPRDAAGRIAVGVDPRTRGFATDALADTISQLEARADVDLRVVFLDCDDDVLIRRFTETRRRHPLATDRPIADGIAIERRMLGPVRELATAVLDTSSSNLAEFRENLISSLSLDARRAMTVTVVSFAFRSGLPREADLVFDVRFLANPHYVPELRPRDGRDPEVGAFVAGDPGFAPFFDSLTGLIGPLLPRYAREGKSYLTVAIGCTGGKHRSVHVAERLAEWLKSAGTPVTLRHRDLPREGGGAPAI